MFADHRFAEVHEAGIVRHIEQVADFIFHVGYFVRIYTVFLECVRVQKIILVQVLVLLQELIPGFNEFFQTLFLNSDHKGNRFSAHF